MKPIAGALVTLIRRLRKKWRLKWLLVSEVGRPCWKFLTLSFPKSVTTHCVLGGLLELIFRDLLSRVVESGLITLANPNKKIREWDFKLHPGDSEATWVATENTFRRGFSLQG